MFYLAQAGSALKALQTDGTVTALSLPSGVTITATARGRFVAFAQQVLFVNAATINLWVDPSDLTVRPMGLRPPLNAPDLAAGSGTGLSGVYRAAVAYFVKNAAGEVVNMSPVTGISLASATLANKDLAWTNIPICPDAAQFISATGLFVLGRRLYRTAAGGSVLFQMQDLDDNVSTSILDTMPDATLSDLPASPDLGLAPGSIPGTGLGLITEWKNRLWAVSSDVREIDQLLFTEVDLFYGWNSDNRLTAYPVGKDRFGITGFLRRRDYLGVCRRDRVLKVIGSSLDDFELVSVTEGAGCVAPESCVVIQDKGYFLGLDGVYRWDDEGVVNISEATVNPWFMSDTYFNRSRFENAFARWNPLTNSYELHLAALGSSVEDRWVAYDIGKSEWLGPHKTAAFTPTSAALLEASSDAYLPAIGASDGYVYLLNQTTPSDISGAAVASAIQAFLEPGRHFDKAPDITHFFGRLSVLSRIESSGSLTVTPYVGRVDAIAGAAITHDLTTGREILRRIGVGPMCRLRFEQNTVAKRFLLYGYEIKPVFEVGLR